MCFVEMVSCPWFQAESTDTGSGGQTCDAQQLHISTYDAVDEMPTRVSKVLARSTLLASGSGYETSRAAPPRAHVNTEADTTRRAIHGKIRSARRTNLEGGW
jgi:hypothetical protein